MGVGVTDVTLLRASTSVLATGRAQQGWIGPVLAGNRTYRMATPNLVFGTLAFI